MTTGHPGVVGNCAIDARAVSKFFGSVAVLRDVTLSVGRGERALLVGGANSGKTTLLKILAGHVTPSGGRIRIGGVDARSARLALNSRVGLIGQHCAPAPTMRIAELLQMSGQSRQIPREVMEERIAAVIDRCALGGVAPSLTRVDGGLRMRVALAVALLHGPAVILLDDSLTHLDQTESQVMVRILDGLRDDKLTVLVAGDSGVRRALPADRVFELRHGRVQRERRA